MLVFSLDNDENKECDQIDKEISEIEDVMKQIETQQLQCQSLSKEI